MFRRYTIRTKTSEHRIRHLALLYEYRLPEVGLNSRNMVARAHYGRAEVLRCVCIGQNQGQQRHSTCNW